MKPNKTMKLQRNIKLHAFQHIDSDTDQQEKHNYFPESNRTLNLRAARRRLRRSSDAGSGGGGEYPRRKHVVDKSSNLKLKDDDDVPNITRQKTVPIRNFYHSPRRNGLSPRIDMLEGDDDDYDDAKLSRSIGGGINDEYDEQHNSNRRSQLNIKNINKPTYTCSACGARFHIKSLLGAHRHTHDDDFKVRFRSRRGREESTGIDGATNGKQCKFCDRFFDLERALRIHQMCHCSKITPQQRRKLGYTDLAHEKKNAPLPTFQRMPKSQTALERTVPDPNMPYVALGPGAIKMIEQEKQMKAKRSSVKYTVKVAGPMGRWR